MKPELLPIRRLASSETLNLAVYRFQGKPGAPSAYLQASLHGSEVQGNWVIAELLERLPKTEILGNITLVPCANPHAQNTKHGEYTMGRYDPTDGDNWNRTFVDLSALAETVEPVWPQAKEQFRAKLLKALEAPEKPEAYARHLARTLQRLAAAHDFVLDLHCASISDTYAYVPSYAMKSFPLLPCRHALRMANDFGGAMDEAFFVPWWKLGERIEKATGKFPELPEAFTLELGVQDTSQLALAKRQAEGILHFLAAKGVVRGNFEALSFPSRFSCDQKNYETFYASSSGFLSLEVKIGEPLEAGQPFYQYLRFQPFERETIHAKTRILPLTFTNSSSVHQGTELGKFMTELTPV
jgi:predicted deacylase